MKSLPFVLIALLLVGGAVIYFLLAQRKQQAKVIEGVPLVTAGGSVSDTFVDEVASDLGFV